MTSCIRHFAEVDSTSSRVEALLQAGEKPPFAVRADRQSAGRGRRGAGWESPAGNLHMTIALASDAAGPALAPLKAAVLVARFIEARCGLRVTLKWPNDLFFGGAKIGGLLLEGSWRGGVPGAISVGIGLNLLDAPVLAPPVRAASLREILGPSAESVLQPATFGEGLAAYFVEEWPRLGDRDVITEFEHRAVQVGQLWRTFDDPPHYARSAGLSASGALELDPLLGGATESLTSVDHKYAWIYQGTLSASTPLIVADCGNTATKVAFYTHADDARPDRLTRFKDSDATQLAIHLASLTQALPVAPWPLFAISVNPKRLDALMRCGDEAGLDVVVLRKRAIRRRSSSAYPLSELGQDRLAAIEGWLGRCAINDGKTAKPALIIAAGTALTIDAVAADGTHVGGLIAPGLQLSLDTLHGATGLLPPLHVETETAAALGQGTKSAMRSGVLLAALGAIERAAEASFPGLPVDLVLTGGGAAALEPHLPHAIVLPDLIVDGARLAVLGGLLRALPGARA